MSGDEKLVSQCYFVIRIAYFVVFVFRVYHNYSQHDYANICNCRRFTNIFIAFTIYCFGNNLLYSTNIRHYLISITINMSKLKGILLKYITLSLMTMSDFNTRHL